MTRTHAERLPEVAFYYPWPSRNRTGLSGWMKTMLLFYDGIALLVPSEALDLARSKDRELVEPLLDEGLLHFLDPQELIDEATGQRLLDFMMTLATSERFESPKYRRWQSDLVLYPSRSLRQSRLAPHLIPAATMLWEEFQAKGLASQFLRDNTIRVHPELWAAILTFIAHALRPSGFRIGLDLQPVTDNYALVESLIGALDIPTRPSTGEVLAFDLEQVTLDLSLASLEEVLEFRSRHGKEYRSYMQDLRRFMSEVSRSDEAERWATWERRRNEIADAADELRHLARTWWRGRPLASFGLGLAGAVWSGSQGNWPAAVIALAGGAVGASNRPELTSIYSYLFRAERSLSRSVPELGES
jgi:hypothetical protein